MSGLHCNMQLVALLCWGAETAEFVRAEAYSFRNVHVLSRNAIIAITFASKTRCSKFRLLNSKNLRSYREGWYRGCRIRRQVVTYAVHYDSEWLIPIPEPGLFLSRRPRNLWDSLMPWLPSFSASLDSLYPYVARGWVAGIREVVGWLRVHWDRRQDRQMRAV